MLDGVLSYLPSPEDIDNVALDLANNEEAVPLTGIPSDPFVGLAFKLEEGRFGQLTYLRIYQGTLRRGETIVSVADKKKVRLSEPSASVAYHPLVAL